MSNNAEVKSSLTQDADYHLTGAHIRYSSWTVRVVAVLEHFQIPYTVDLFNKTTPEGHKAIKLETPAGWVPVLTVRSLGITLHDSLSILEFLAESHPELSLWPRNRKLRALARSYVAEMHSGFQNIRNLYGSNYIARYEGEVPTEPEVDKEVARLLEIFGGMRRTTVAVLKEEGGKDEGYLFGSFSIADAVFWPILWRFRTYNVDLTKATPEALAWIRLMWNEDPVLKAIGKRIYKEAENPRTIIESYDNLWPEKATMVKIPEDWKFEL
ncbi:hypothetical protein RUND412_005879 [Rhizina undulata]